MKFSQELGFEKFGLVNVRDPDEFTNAFNSENIVIRSDSDMNPHMIVSSSAVSGLVSAIKRDLLWQDLDKRAEVIMRQCSIEVREKFLNGTYILYLSTDTEKPYLIRTSDDTKFYDVDANGAVRRRLAKPDLSGFERLGEKAWRDLSG